MTCKYCGSEGVVKYGTYKGVQRYWCKVCKRKFKDDDTLFHMKVSPDFISSALDMYYTGSSINDICEHFRTAKGYHPSKSVVFGWIKKYGRAGIGEHYWLLFHNGKKKMYLVYGGATRDIANKKGLEMWGSVEYEIKRLPTRNLALAASLMRGGTK